MFQPDWPASCFSSLLSKLYPRPFTLPDTLLGNCTASNTCFDVISPGRPFLTTCRKQQTLHPHPIILFPCFTCDHSIYYLVVIILLLFIFCLHWNVCSLRLGSAGTRDMKHLIKNSTEKLTVFSTKKFGSQGWWCISVVPALWVAGAGGSQVQA